MSSQEKCSFCDAASQQKIKNRDSGLQDYVPYYRWCGECEPECFKCGDLHPALEGSCSCLSKERNFAEEARRKIQQDQRMNRLNSGNAWGGMYGP